MRITYSYPALTTVQRRSASQPWLRIVKADGSAMVDEYSSEDIPVAAVVSVVDRDGGERIRFHEGRFYLNTHSSDIDSAVHQTNMVATRAIADSLVEGRKHLAAIHPKEIRRPLWNLWLAGRDNLSIPASFRSAFLSPATLTELPEFNPAKHDRAEFDLWARHHLSLVSEIIMIDGEVWLPIKEPILNNHISMPYEWSYDDVAVYDMRKGRPGDLPAPFGKRITTRPDGSWDSRYWRPGFKFVSLPEAEELGANWSKWLCDVMMPEAFTADILSLEMDRAARLAVVAIRDQIARSNVNDFIRRDDQLSAHMKALSRLVKGTKEIRSAEEIEGPLSRFLAYTLADVRSPYHNGNKFRGRGSVSEMMKDVLTRWYDRPVSLELGDAPSPSSSMKP